MVVKHRRTDPACSRFRGYPTNPLTRWWFDRGRGWSCVHCMHLRGVVAAVHLKFQQDTGLGLWTCQAREPGEVRGCGWTNTSNDAACVRCGSSAVDGYGFRI